MQLRLDAADRLVELVEERRGPVAADEAARLVLKLGSQVPVGLARSLLDEAVRADARLRWAGDLVAVDGAPGEALALEQATFVVFDLETTGLRPSSARPCEIGAVRVRALALEERFQTLANPGARLDPRSPRSRGSATPSCAGHRRPGGGPAVPRFRRRRDPRCAQRALRHGVPRQRDDARDGPPRRRHGRRHGRACAPPARAAAGEPRRALVPFRDGRATVSPCVTRRGGDGRDPALPDRHGAGARRAHHRRPRRAGGDPAAARPPQAKPRVRRAAATRRLPLP